MNNLKFSEKVLSDGIFNEVIPNYKELAYTINICKKGREWYLNNRVRAVRESGMQPDQY